MKVLLLWLFNIFITCIGLALTVRYDQVFMAGWFTSLLLLSVIMFSIHALDRSVK